MRRRRIDPSVIGDLIPSVLKGLRGPGGEKMARARAAWAEVVGSAVARRTRLVDASQGLLQVVVASAALKHDLATFRREAVLEGLQSRLPDMALKGVRYRVGAVS